MDYGYGLKVFYYVTLQLVAEQQCEIILRLNTKL